MPIASRSSTVTSVGAASASLRSRAASNLAPCCSRVSLGSPEKVVPAGTSVGAGCTSASTPDSTGTSTLSSTAGAGCTSASTPDSTGTSTLSSANPSLAAASSNLATSSTRFCSALASASAAFLCSFTIREACALVAAPVATISSTRTLSTSCWNVSSAVLSAISIGTPASVNVFICS